MDLKLIHINNMFVKLIKNKGPKQENKWRNFSSKDEVWRQIPLLEKTISDLEPLLFQQKLLNTTYVH